MYREHQYERASAYYIHVEELLVLSDFTTPGEIFALCVLAEAGESIVAVEPNDRVCKGFSVVCDEEVETGLTEINRAGNVSAVPGTTVRVPDTPRCRVPEVVTGATKATAGGTLRKESFLKSASQSELCSHRRWVVEMAYLLYRHYKRKRAQKASAVTQLGSENDQIGLSNIPLQETQTMDAKHAHSDYNKTQDGTRMGPSEEPAGRKQEKRAARVYRWKLIGGLFFPFTIQALDTTIVAGALPFIASDFRGFKVQSGTAG